MTGRAKAKANNPMVACTILPKAWDELPMRGGEEIDGWDFVLRNAFILRDSPIKKALACVACFCMEEELALADPLDSFALSVIFPSD